MSVFMQVPSGLQQIKPTRGYGQPSQREISRGDGTVYFFGGPVAPAPVFSSALLSWRMARSFPEKTKKGAAFFQRQRLSFFVCGCLLI
jgi:hypothetical protein